MSGAASDDAIVVARFIVSGKVQGVSYRAATRSEAERLGLHGHARNRMDGAVEVIAAGHAGAIDALEAWLWNGPPLAEVEAVQRSPADEHPAPGFRVF